MTTNPFYGDSSSVARGVSCIRGLRIPVATIMGRLTADRSHDEILAGLEVRPHTAGDDIILDHALQHEQVVISNDTDFGSPLRVERCGRRHLLSESFRFWPRRVLGLEFGGIGANVPACVYW